MGKGATAAVMVSNVKRRVTRAYNRGSGVVVNTHRFFYVQGEIFFHTQCSATIVQSERVVRRIICVPMNGIFYFELRFYVKIPYKSYMPFLRDVKSKE